MILNNVPLFHKLGEMPITSDPARLDYGSGIEKKMAKYHKRFGLCLRMANLNVLENEDLVLKVVP